MSKYYGIDIYGISIDEFIVSTGEIVNKYECKFVKLNNNKLDEIFQKLNESKKSETREKKSYRYFVYRYYDTVNYHKNKSVWIWVNINYYHLLEILHRYRIKVNGLLFPFD